MKRCPQCNRPYHDETMNYCLEDGERLVTDVSVHEHKTEVMHGGWFAEGVPTVPRGLSGSSNIGFHWTNSIAVLPFTNMSADPENEYFCDGLAEELSNALTKVEQLKVAARTSAFSFRNRSVAINEIGRVLKVNTILEGSVRKFDDQLRITVQLVDTTDGYHLWSERYDRELRDIFNVQDEITLAVVDALKLKLLAPEKRAILKRHTNDAEAYHLYLRGQFFLLKRTKASMLQAVDYYRQAIAIDPNFALAYARIAEVYLNLPPYPYASPIEAIPEGKSAAEKALELDPNLAEAHTFMGYYLAAYEWSWAEAEREFRRAIELDPNSSAAHYRYAHLLLMPTGRIDECITEIEKALEFEPLDIVVGSSKAYVHILAGLNEKALEIARKTNELEPKHPISLWFLAMAYSANGMYKEAITACEKGLDVNPTNQRMLQQQGIAYARSNRINEADEVLKRFPELEKTGYVSPYLVATVFAALGRRDDAFAMLDKACESRDWYLHLVKIDCFMDPLRDDPRFDEFVKRLKYPS